MADWSNASEDLKMAEQLIHHRESSGKQSLKSGLAIRIASAKGWGWGDEGGGAVHGHVHG